MKIERQKSVHSTDNERGNLENQINNLTEERNKLAQENNSLKNHFCSTSK